LALHALRAALREGCAPHTLGAGMPGWLLQGAAAGPLHPRAGALPLNPKMVLTHIKRLVCMPLVCRKPHAEIEA